MRCQPISRNSGGWILHLCRFLNTKPSHRGTSTGLPGLKGPQLPYKKEEKKVKRNPFKNSRKRKEKEEEGKKLN